MGHKQGAERCNLERDLQQKKKKQKKKKEEDKEALLQSCNPRLESDCF